MHDSVWLLKTDLTSLQEDNLQQETWLKLPFPGLPDLAGIASLEDMQRLLAHIDANAAPESINRRADVHWRNLGLSNGDLVIVPLTFRQGNFAIGEVVTRYRYRVAGGEDVHEVEVKWLLTDVPKRRLSYLTPLMDSPSRLQPVPEVEQRKQAYRLLRRGYNRFMKIRWLVGAVIVLKIIEMLLVQKHGL